MAISEQSEYAAIEPLRAPAGRPEGVMALAMTAREQVNPRT